MCNVIITIKLVMIRGFEQWAVCANGKAYTYRWSEADAYTLAKRIEMSGQGLFEESI
jgi:hypothetical protein